MDKPRALDLFCGAGGSTRGLQLAGFHVTGVDIKAQPHYVGDAFVMGDALDYCRAHGAEYDCIVASPPCQCYTQAQRIQGREHPDLIPPTREALVATGRPWVIENVPGAPLRIDLILCGSMFGLQWRDLMLYRHRWFESGGGFDLQPFPPAMCVHDRPAISIFGHCVLGGALDGKGYKHPNEREHLGADVGRTVMGIDWMTRNELSEAIPPAYFHFIGDQLMQVVRYG